MAKKQRRKSTGRTVAKHKARSPQAVVSTRLLGDIRSLIERARENTARAVNSALVELYWRIGKRIREDVLHEQRAEYGEEIVATLSQQLAAEYGRGFDRTNLSRMVKLVDHFPDETIVAEPSQQLSWSHFREILPLDDRLKRDFGWKQYPCRPVSYCVTATRRVGDQAAPGDPSGAAATSEAT